VSIGLGVDLATANARVVAVDDDGAVLAERDTSLPAVESPAEGAREQRPVYLETVTTLLGLVAADLGLRAEEVRGLAEVLLPAEASA